MPAAIIVLRHPARSAIQPIIGIVTLRPRARGPENTGARTETIVLLPNPRVGDPPPTAEMECVTREKPRPPVPAIARVRARAVLRTQGPVPVRALAMPLRPRTCGA